MGGAACRSGAFGALGGAGLRRIGVGARARCGTLALHAHERRCVGEGRTQGGAVRGHGRVCEWACHVAWGRRVGVVLGACSPSCHPQQGHG